jgi:hypothetical protein
LDLVARIIQYEGGEMTDAETITFFQELINSGMCWNLQGHYGRTAFYLIEHGFCHWPKEPQAQ